TSSPQRAVLATRVDSSFQASLNPMRGRGIAIPGVAGSLSTLLFLTFLEAVGPALVRQPDSDPSRQHLVCHKPHLRSPCPAVPCARGQGPGVGRPPPRRLAAGRSASEPEFTGRCRSERQTQTKGRLHLSLTPGTLAARPGD